MMRSDIDLPPWAETFRATFERVAHHLELGEGFMLLPVELPDSITANLLVHWLTGRGLGCHLVEFNTESPPSPLLERLLAAPDTPTATLLFIDKLTDWLPGALQLLNQQRDVLAQRHPRPLLWCGPSRFLDLTWHSAPDLWSIAAVPIRLPTPTTRSPNPDAKPDHVDHRTALAQLLRSMYSAEELLRFVHLHFGIEIANDLPSIHSSTVQLAYALTDVLEARGLIDRALFERLRSERPGWYREIDAVAQMWLGARRLATGGSDRETSVGVLQVALSQGNQIVFVVGADLMDLYETVEDSADEGRLAQRVRTVPVRAMHDEDSDWVERSNRAPRPSSTAPAEVTIIVDGEGQPLGEPDHAQMTEIRRLIKQAGDANAHGRPFQLIIPVTGTRATAEATARGLIDAIRSARLPVHIVDLDAPQKG